MDDVQALSKLEAASGNNDIEDYLDKLVRIHNLGCESFIRFQETKAIDDLQKAISCLQATLNIASQKYPYFTKLQYDLQISLQNRYRQIQSTDDLQKAIELGEAVVDSTPEEDLSRALRSSNLGNAFNDRYEDLGDPRDLDKAIHYGQIAVNASRKNDPQLAHRLECLGTGFYDRYRRQGSRDDLEEGIRHWQTAVANTADDHPQRGRRLDDVGAGFFVLFQLDGRMSDLLNAIHFFDLAVKITPDDHVEHTERLGNLGAAYHAQYTRTGAAEDLQKAINVGKPAVDAIPMGHSQRPGILDKLAIMLFDRYQCSPLTDSSDLQEAIRLWKISVSVTPTNHPERGERLSNLGSALNAKALWKEKNPVEVLREAIHYMDEAVKATPQDHPEQTRLLNNLGIAYQNLYKQTKSTVDQETGRIVLLKSLYHANGSPLLRLNSGSRAADIAVEGQDWTRACDLLKDSLDLLPKIAKPINSHDDLQHVLRQLSDLGPQAASVYLKAGKSALESLQAVERCRGVIASLIIDSRSDVSLLEERYPDLGSEYRHLREVIAASTFAGNVNRLSTLPSQPADSASLSLQTMQDAKKLENVLGQIRQRPSFERFQLPLTEQVMCSIARSGPIVSFNCTPLGSHAFLITSNIVSVLPLPKLTLGDLEMAVSSKTSRDKIRRNGNLATGEEDERDSSYVSVSSQVESMLWLWKVAVKPVLEKLGLKKEKVPAKTPCLWWVGGGLMALLPIHAAGDHRSGSTDNCISHAISSYAPTLKSLQFSQTKTPTPLTPRGSNVLVVAMDRTPGHEPLNLREEINAIQSHVGSSASVQVLERPTAAAVLECITACSMVHFACHGILDAEEPSNSALLLGNTSVENLTVGDLQPVSHQLAQVAYLSACSTASIGTRSLIDESIHLASTFQLVGFRHVVGTMWDADDEAAVAVAASFYERLFLDTGTTAVSVATALHHAVLDYKIALDGMEDGMSAEKKMQLWAPFLHFGP